MSSQLFKMQPDFRRTSPSADDPSRPTDSWMKFLWLTFDDDDFGNGFEYTEF